MISKVTLSARILISVMISIVSGFYQINGPRTNLLHISPGSKHERDPCHLDNKLLQDTCTRRKNFAQVISVSSILSLVTSSYPRIVSASTSAGEAIRQSAANLPGYGKPDVYYPPIFEGTFQLTRISDSGNFVVFTSRFILEDNGKVIADRGFNQANFLKTMSNAKPVRSVSWEALNPNVLTTTFGDGSVQEIKVTKRAYDMESPTTMFTSEYRRVTNVDGARGIPAISGERVLTKWIWDPEQPNRIDGLEIVYSDGVMGDPMAAGPSTGQASKTSTKSRLVLERLK